MKAQNKVLSFTIISSLVVLSACDWFGGKKADTGMPTGGNVQDGSEVLVTMKGRPLISRNMLDSEKKKLFENNPQLQAMAGLMDERQLNRNLIDGLASREVIREYIKDNKIEESDKFRKDFDNVLARLKDALYTQYFMEGLNVEVSDAEVNKYYDENKESIPNLLVSRGGVRAKGLAFNDESVARDFALKVKAAKNDLEKVAKENNVIARMKNFNLVNDQSLGMDTELRDKVMEISRTPSVETFKVGKEFWVVAASDKEDAKFRPVEQVSAELKETIKQEKKMKRFEEEISRLKDSYSIVINEDKFAENPAMDVMTAEGDKEEKDLVTQDENQTKPENTKSA